MSTERKSRLPDNYQLTTFYGGANRGVCLQVTPINDVYMQLSKADVHALMMDLLDYEADALEELA